MGDFLRNASLLAWAVQQGERWVIIQAAHGMECVGMLEHALVCGDREERGEQRQEEQRRAEKRRIEMKSQKAYFGKDVRGGMYTHVGRTIDIETGIMASLEKLSPTPSYMYTYAYMYTHRHTLQGAVRL